MKINIFTWNFKIFSTGSFFAVFTRKNIKFMVCLLFMRKFLLWLYIYWFWLLLHGDVQYIFKSYSPWSKGNIFNFDIKKNFLNPEKIMDFVKKKRHVHSFGSNLPILNQKKHIHIEFHLISYGSYTFNIFWVSFFFDKVLEGKLSFFLKCEKKYL